MTWFCPTHTTLSAQFLHFPVIAVPSCQFPTLLQASRACMCVRACAHACMSTMFPVVWLQVLFHWLLESGRPRPCRARAEQTGSAAAAGFPVLTHYSFSLLISEKICGLWYEDVDLSVWLKLRMTENENVWTVVGTVEGFRPLWCWCHWQRADDGFSCFPQEQEAAHGSDSSLISP